MHVLARGVVKPAVRLLLTFLIGVLGYIVVAQETTTTPPPASNTKAAPTTSDTKPMPSTSVAATGIRPDAYIIGAEDVLSVYVWKEPDMSKSVPVRPDGMISLPLIGEVKAAGYTPVQLQGVLADAMKKYVSDPQVTVVVEKVASLNFNIVGEVNKPGYYPLTRRLTVLDAIALAGGFKDFAKTKKVYILRTSANGAEQRIPFNYNEVIKGKNSQQNIDLQPRDTIVVP
ncbi:MAG TPA: polysaccharide biosynthesis/export family protein [Candidatus Binatia bacterium]|jgi:polysaccharide export outer membrane protein|nr:polysaccharide biosynthesis/export family protein [Candidatus Binatia bacterium]